MFPKTGNEVPTPQRGATAQRCAQAIGEALRSELGESHRSAKTVMKWTGACERSAKNWIGGHKVPSGWHLILLARHSRSVAMSILSLANRDHLSPGVSLRQLRNELITTAYAIDAVLGDPEVE